MRNFFWCFFCFCFFSGEVYPMQSAKTEERYVSRSGEGCNFRQTEAADLYNSGLCLIANNSYDIFKEHFSRLSSDNQGIIFSYFMSFLAERSGLNTRVLERNMVSDISRSQETEIYDRIHLDNKLASEFVKSAWSGKEISWEMFLGDSLSKTISSLETRLDSDAFLSGRQIYLNPEDLNSSERKLLMASYSLNLLKESENAHNISIFSELMKFQNIWDSLQEANPYYQYLENVSTVGLNFNDYAKFFNYKNLIEFDTTFYIAYGLLGSGVTPLGSIGQISGSLREVVRCFLAHKLDEKDLLLFSRFEDLGKESSFTD